VSLENVVQQVKEEIARLNQVLRLLEGTGAYAGPKAKRANRVTTAQPKRKMSAAGRRRIAAAARARWAKFRAAKKTA
jgi:hypothetical protein